MKPIEKGTHTKERKKDHWSLTVFEPLQTGKYLKPVSSFSYNAFGFIKNNAQCTPFILMIQSCHIITVVASSPDLVTISAAHRQTFKSCTFQMMRYSKFLQFSPQLQILLMNLCPSIILHLPNHDPQLKLCFRILIIIVPESHVSFPLGFSIIVHRLGHQAWIQTCIPKMHALELSRMISSAKMSLNFNRRHQFIYFSYSRPQAGNSQDQG